MMKKNEAAVVIGLCLLLSGCSRSYWVDRARDGRDCLTVAGGVGLGAKVMAGPLNTGLFFNGDAIGIREGVVIHNREAYEENLSINTLLLPIARAIFFDRPDFKNARFGMDLLPSRTSDYAEYVNYYPVIAKLRTTPDRPRKGTPAAYTAKYHANQYYTQFEVAGGVIGTLRLGLNPGEIADFVLGFFGVDIYDDDVYPYQTLPEKLRAD